MTGRTGPPRIAGTLYAHQAAVEVEAVPVATLRDGPGGSEAVVDQTYQVLARVVWSVMTEAEATAIQEDAAGEFSAELRTEAPDDPDWSEALVLDMIATSDAVLTAPTKRDTDRAARYEVAIEMESLRDDLTASDLGIEVGAFVLVDETADYYEIQAEDGASITDGPTQTVALEEGGTVTIGSYDFGDDRAAAARITEDGTTHYLIQTRAPASGGGTSS